MSKTLIPVRILPALALRNVNTYVQQPTTDDKKIVFVTEAIENIPPGYPARETYTILSRDEFTERFELAEPGKDFALYSEAHLKRVH